MAAGRDNIDISEQPRDQRKDYLKYRKDAAPISKLYPNSDIGAAIVEYCEALDAAIASVDMALKIAR
jgi:hypothetical protein